MSEIAAKVRIRAGGLCEYCRLPQSVFKRSFHLEHIVAKKHQGEDTFENLALACWNCNLRKGPNLSGIDPETGLVTQLFNPRKDEWDEHFMAVVGGLNPLGIAIVGISAVGRSTVQVLGLNEEMRQMVRYEVWREGRYPVVRMERSGSTGGS